MFDPSPYCHGQMNLYALAAKVVAVQVRVQIPKAILPQFARPPAAILGFSTGFC